MFDLIEDLSKLTSIPLWQFQKLQQLTKEDICQCFVDSMNNEEEICKIDVGIGNLFIGVKDDNIVYKFIPDKQLEQMMIESANAGKEYLKDRIEISNNMRMLKIYKELL
jgi:hypothetical protein